MTLNLIPSVASPTDDDAVAVIDSAINALTSVRQALCLSRAQRSQSGDDPFVPLHAFHVQHQDMLPSVAALRLHLREAERNGIAALGAARKVGARWYVRPRAFLTYLTGSPTATAAVAVADNNRREECSDE